MDKKTLKALTESIDKWDAMADGSIQAHPSPDNCPLCQLFNSAEEASLKDCQGCPVFELTHKRYCEDTPYVAFFDSCDRFPLNENGKALARTEANFLRALLP